MVGNPKLSRAIHVIAWSVALALGARQIWSRRFGIFGDGISYLDIGDAFAHGDWASAINAYWSPLYAWLLGLTLRAAGMPPEREFAAIAGFNFVVFICALASFSYLITRLVRHHWDGRGQDAAQIGNPLPQWAALALGYAVFVWVSIELLAIGSVAPDVAVSAVVYLATALVVRIRAGETRIGLFVGLGALLGIGYLVKAPLFVLAPVFIACAAMAAGNLRRAVTAAASASLAFILIAGPFVTVISVEKGRFTFSDAGRLNVAWDTNGVSRMFWQGGPPGSGMPVQPPRQIQATPAVFEFARPIRATYPLWHDPSYWYQGLTTYFTLEGVKRPLSESGRLYRHLTRRQAPFVAGVLLLCLFSGQPWRLWRTAGAQWHLWAPGIAALGLFAIAGAEARYVGSFVALVMLAALMTVRLKDRSAARSVLVAVTIAMLLFQAADLTSVRSPVPVRDTPNPHAETASALGRLGVRRGDRVAIMRQTPGSGIYWARIAGVQIVAEIPRDASHDYWVASDNVKRETHRAIARTGSTLLVTFGLPISADVSGWVQLGNTPWHAYILE